MDELVSVMQEILRELKAINSNLEEIKKWNQDVSISDLCSKLDDLRGSGSNSIDDVCSKLDDVCFGLDNIEASID